MCLYIIKASGSYVGWAFRTSVNQCVLWHFLRVFCILHREIKVNVKRPPQKYSHFHDLHSLCVCTSWVEVGLTSVNTKWDFTLQIHYISAFFNIEERQSIPTSEGLIHGMSGLSLVKKKIMILYIKKMLTIICKMYLCD